MAGGGRTHRHVLHCMYEAKAFLILFVHTQHLPALFSTAVRFDQLQSTCAADRYYRLEQ